MDWQNYRKIEQWRNNLEYFYVHQKSNGQDTSIELWLLAYIPNIGIVIGYSCV